MIILAKGLMSNLPDSSISLQAAKYINEINHRKYFLIMFATAFFTSTTQPNQDLAEPLIFIPMNH